MADWMIILVLSLHLFVMNVASAGPLFCIWLGRRGEKCDPAWDAVGRSLAWLSFWAMLLGVVTGGGQMLVAPSAGLQAAIARLPSRALWVAGSEIVFSLACLLLYAGCWRSLQRHRWWHASLALVSSSNLLYHFPPLMSVLGKLANDPTWAKAQTLDRAALLPLMARSEIVALSAHFVLASIAVAAVVVLWIASKSDEEIWESSTLPLTRRTAWTALIVSALQLPVGFWLLISLPQSARTAMMGNNAIASLAFVGAMLLTFVLLQRLLTIAIGTVRPSDLRQVCWLVATLVFLMTATLYESRNDRKHARPIDPEKKNSRRASCATAVGSVECSNLKNVIRCYSDESLLV